jgi:hypothetical protein
LCFIKICRISDKVSSFGFLIIIQNKNVLIAQIIWYFIEGYNYRSNEYPFGSKENYLKYIVPFEDEELVFYKSNKTERWWIEIPFFSNVNNKLKKNTLLPCSYEDYLRACDQEIPERWWKAQRKNHYLIERFLSITNFNKISAFSIICVFYRFFLLSIK